jgi:hypothetical protein
LDEAARAGGQLVAAEDMARAQSLRDEALRHRQAARWEECYAQALQAEQLAASVLKQALARRNVAAEALLESATGKVQSRGPSEATWKPVIQGARLVEGERVRTLSGASAVLRLSDGSRLRLGENAQVVIQQMRMDLLEQRQSSRVSVVEGDAQALLGSSRGNLQVEAGGSGARVKTGSRNYWVGRAQGGQVRLANYDEAELEVETEGGRVLLGRNQGALVERGKKPTVRKQLLPEAVLATPTAGELLYARTVRLEWQPTPGAASYWLEVATDDGFTSMHASLKDLVDPSFTFAAPADGAWYWRVSAIDGDGFPGPRSEARRFTVLRDVEPPHLFAQALRERTRVREATFTFTGETEPGATLTLDGKPLEVGPDGRFSAKVELTPGSRVLELVATDPAGNTNRLQHALHYQPPEPLRVDFAPEVVRQGERHLLTPGPLLVLRGTTRPDTALTVTAEGGAVIGRGHSDGEGAFLLHLPLAARAQRLRLALQAADGDTGEEPFSVEVDEEPPGLTLEPEPPAFTGSPTLQLSGTVLGATGLWLEGTPLPVEEGRFSHAVTLRPGPNLLRLEARDAVGHRTTLERTVHLDREAPQLLEYAVSPSAVAPGGRVTVRVRARDDSGLRSAARYVLHVGRERLEGFLRLNRASGEYQAVLPVPPTAQGPVQLRQLRLEDAHGNQREHAFK